jgi:hypothetical protein
MLVLMSCTVYIYPAPFSVQSAGLHARSDAYFGSCDAIWYVFRAKSRSRKPQPCKKKSRPDNDGPKAGRATHAAASKPKQELAAAAAELAGRDSGKSWQEVQPEQQQQQQQGEGVSAQSMQLPVVPDVMVTPEHSPT